jgi:hypothetical protein
VVQASCFSRGFVVGSPGFGFTFPTENKSMKIFTAVLVMTFIIGLTWVHVTAQSEDKGVIDKYISGQARRERGEEPDGIRKTIDGDLNRDGIADVAVLYTIEGQGGSNNYIQYLAVFLRRKTGLVFVARAAVGGKNRREIEFTSIQDNVMNFNTTGYADRDPSCCPTIKGNTRYALVGNRLVERRAKMTPRAN